MQPHGTILVVDDRESSRHLLKEILESAGHSALCASDGAQAIELAVTHRPDAILLDVKMPGMDGFEVFLKLQGLAETARIPIIFVTANYAEEQDVLHGLGIGAYDYLVKPISRSLLLARVAVVLRIHRSEERARQLSMIDEFTGLFSKNYVVRRLEEDMRRAERCDSPLTVTMLDLDDFRSCNDTFGHQLGDEVLKRVSVALRASLRPYDSIGRYGGEEFLIVQPGLTESEAFAMTGRLKERVAEECSYGENRELRVTFSAGIAEWDRRLGADELIHSADCALCAAKRAGKSQTVCYAQMNGAAAAATVAR
ncbi:MAG TPA: diguanylate cyclase [Candidatus Binatia bacterium]|nr:diguanylate cyclase [Candidatus Binatia bacterium]